MKWYYFDPAKGYRQKRPPERKHVLIQCKSNIVGAPDPVVVGYRRDAAGDKSSPYFVHPGVNCGDAYRWCDCLPDGFKWPSSPLEIMEQIAAPVDRNMLEKWEASI